MNGNQRRHLAANLRLLAEDLAHVKALPALPDNASVAIDAVTACVERMSQEFALTVARETDPARSARVLADTWTVRSHDLRVASFVGYGPIHPQLAERLDPLIDELQSALRDLAVAGRTGLGGTS